MKLFSIVFFIILLSGTSGFGQVDTSARQLARLREQVGRGSYFTAIPELEKMAQTFPKNVKLHQLLGEAYQEARLPEKAAMSFESGYLPKAKGSAKWLLPILVNYHQAGNLNKTKVWIEEIGKRKDADAITKNKAKQIEQSLAEMAKADTLSSRYAPDTSFAFPNSGYADFAPLRMNDSTLIFSSLRQDSVLYYDPSLPNFNTTKIHVLKTTSSPSFEKIEAPKVLNLPGQYTGNGSLSPDGKWFYFSRCQQNRIGKLTCAIYKAELENGRFKNVSRLDDAINKAGSNNTQPFVVVNAGPKNTQIETLYFISDRKGGAGGNDIWVSTYNLKKRKFGNASNLGRAVNSAGDEATPFFDRVGGHMYFSSNGHVGHGGHDVFLSRKAGNGFGKPINLGKPVNSNADDRYFSHDGSKGAFLSSNRKGAHNLTEQICCEDIFYFKRLPKLDSVQWLAYQEKVRQKPGQLIQQTEIQETKPDESKIATLDPKMAVEQVVVQKTAEPITAKIPVPVVNDSKASDVKTTIILKRISRNIQFEIGSNTLTSATLPYLDSLASLLKSGKTYSLELIGHTDNKGNLAKNMTLSKKRAEAVKKYLVSKGLVPARIVTMGKGPKVPLLPNQNPDGTDNPGNRTQNRRVTLKLKSS